MSKFKKSIFMFTVMLLIAVFFIPVTVSAVDESDQTETTTELTIQHSPKAFTPDGQATVIDWATDYDGKEFYTFKTPAGNVFYLIIDHLRGADNVYFLNAVTEQDLIALAEQSKNTNNSGGISVIPTTQPPTENKPDDKPDNPPSKQKSNTGMIIFVLLGVAAVGGVAYYMKIIRPKQQANNDDEDDDIPNEGDDTEVEFENEQEDTDDNDDNSDTSDEDDE